MGHTRNAMLQHLLADIGIGVLWAALLVAVVLFSSGVSTFIYVDF